MKSSSTQVPTPNDRQEPRRTGRPRLNRAWTVLLFVVVIVLAVSPIPWW